MDSLGARRGVKMVIGNWKMHKTAKEALSFVRSLGPLTKKSSHKVCLAVPFTAIHAVSLEAKQMNVRIGAQNMHEASEGAFTGEISASMLKEAGADFVLLGHSERRHLFCENDERINQKMLRALSEELQPVLCVGETALEREEGLSRQVVRRQLMEGLKDIHREWGSRIVLAYEPVWAIGTGKTATPELAQEMHAFCRSLLAEHFGGGIEKDLPILYGGSVNLNNVRPLLEQPDIDGVLVGGASLDVELFARLIED